MILTDDERITVLTECVALLAQHTAQNNPMHARKAQELWAHLHRLDEHTAAVSRGDDLK